MSGDGQKASAHDPTWLVELQAVLLAVDGLGAFLDELAQLTVRALAIRASCGVTLQPDGRVRTVAASDDLAMQVDEIRYETGQGPCLDSLATGSVNHVVDLGAEARWPMFCTAALRHGVRSCLSTPLVVRGETLGALNLYATVVDAFDAGARAQAQLFAGHAAGAVAVALRLAREAQVSSDLRAALASRAMIDQAVGVNNGAEPVKRLPSCAAPPSNATSRSTRLRPASSRASAVNPRRQPGSARGSDVPDLEVRRVWRRRAIRRQAAISPRGPIVDAGDATALTVVDRRVHGVVGSHGLAEPGDLEDAPNHALRRGQPHRYPPVGGSLLDPDEHVQSGTVAKGQARQVHHQVAVRAVQRLQQKWFGLRHRTQIQLTVQLHKHTAPRLAGRKLNRRRRSVVCVRHDDQPPRRSSTLAGAPS
jgi:GAF domain